MLALKALSSKMNAISRFTGQAPSSINTWKQFEKDVRLQNKELLAKLDDFPDSIMVTGCQRSGTTMLSRILTQSEGMIQYRFSKDDELDAALILSGNVTTPRKKGRYCFQTTYLNANYHEYYKHQENHKIIWVLRNPFSVIYSMVHNWRRAALGRLFNSCGSQFLEGAELRRYERFGLFGIDKVRQACLSYKGKLSQLFELHRKISRERLLVISYDALTSEKNSALPMIYRFINLPYQKEYADFIHTKSLTKKDRQSKREAALVKQVCLPTYQEAMKLTKREIQDQNPKFRAQKIN